jgi:(-)-germacrene D synthase
MQQVQELKEEVKRMLMAPTEKPLEKLDLIDKIQRLGVSYHFESEINEILQKMHNNPPECNNGDSDEHLYTIALWFRLLRQQGYNVSCGMLLFKISFVLQFVLSFFMENQTAQAIFK